MKCFFFFHRWEPIKAVHYNDASFGLRVAGTKIIYRCNRCMNFKENSMYGVGHLELSELFPLHKLPADVAVAEMREQK